MSIHQKPLADINWKDIQELIARELPEDSMLEFKGKLPERNGRTHVWYEGRDEITPYTRDELAHEVVALANAYGGRLIIGVSETQDTPRRAQALVNLPRCEKFAEQFGQAFRSIVDPPLAGFQIRAVADPDTDDGSGAVIIAVPSSDLAPHGIGKPPQAFVRRGTSCEVMTMRDLQNVFWEARTRQQRVREIRARFIKEFSEIVVLKQKNELIDRNGTVINPTKAGLFVRISAILQQDIRLQDFPFDRLRSHLRPQIARFAQNVAPAFGDGHFHNAWNRMAHGAWCIESGPANWLVRDDGTISISGFKGGYSGLNQDIPRNFHHPAWYSALLAQVMIMSDRLRRDDGRPDIPVEIDIQFHGDGSVEGYMQSENWFADGDFGKMLKDVSIGPILLTDRRSFKETHRLLENEVWHAFGLTNVRSINVDFDKAFADYPPA
jgi:hypothetical protein